LVISSSQTAKVARSRRTAVARVIADTLSDARDAASLCPASATCGGCSTHGAASPHVLRLTDPLTPVTRCSPYRGALRAGSCCRKGRRNLRPQTAHAVRAFQASKGLYRTERWDEDAQSLDLTRKGGLPSLISCAGAVRAYFTSRSVQVAKDRKRTPRCGGVFACADCSCSKGPRRGADHVRMPAFVPTRPALTDPPGNVTARRWS